MEVNDEENTFVLRTGDSEGNYSYMKFDKQAIYQTDAKPEEVKEEKVTESVKKADEVKTEEPFADAAKEEKTAVSDETKDEEIK